MYAIMGSSNKSRKHYKKDSRFVADLYTFTYDDFDLVRSGLRERGTKGDSVAASHITNLSSRIKFEILY